MAFAVLIVLTAPLAQAPLTIEPLDPQMGRAQYQAAVANYLGEPVPAPAPIPTTAPPAMIGLSEPIAAASVAVPQPATCCDSSAQGYVDGLYAQCQCEGKCKCGKRKRKWFGKGDDDDCSGCWKLSTCDLYPHYAYYPKHHGYYYFRPYNYTMVPVQQQIAVRLGADSRNPYTVELLTNLVPATDRPVQSTTRLLRQGRVLPSLEQLLVPTPAAY
jgi:hypothetical protein